MAPSFMVDHMLVKLGKYLRILGYDAHWDTSVRTHELITRANAEGRVFLTRNTRLPSQYPVAERLCQIESTDPVVQLREVLGVDGGGETVRLFSRCIRCNRTLAELTDEAKIARAVHPNVRQQYVHFFECPACGTVFWKGSHVRNTCRKLGIQSVDEMPDRPVTGE